VHQSRRPQVVFGVRGVMGVELTVFGPAKALHSGHYGNWAPNPAARLANLLAGMRDGDGRVLVDGFYDDVRPLTDADREALASVPDVDADLRRDLLLGASEGGGARLVERILQPALNVRGLRSAEVGAKARNAIPTEAVATLGFRLVPDQSPERVRELVETHLRRQGHHIVHEPPDPATRLAHASVVLLEWEEGYRAMRTPLELAASRAVLEVADAALGPVVRMPILGGSLPLYHFEEVLGAPLVVVPIVNHDNNQHAPNENLRLQNLWDGIELYAALFARLGEVWE
jgi:acetylornithine deacetylase/succinyl-diaminopimelate desuccinylase-like protein